jgi:hypothetical protein
MMMNEEQLVRSAIANMLSYAQDNAQRARMRVSAPDMTQLYGESGRTRAEILDDYVSHEYECQRAMEWFEKLVKESK